MWCWEFLKYDSVSGDAAKICQQLKVAVGSPFGAPQEHIHTFFLPDIEHIYMSEKKAKRKEKDNNAPMLAGKIAQKVGSKINEKSKQFS